MAEAHSNNLSTVILGINHVTATVPLRDKALFTKENILELSGELLALDHIEEIVVVSTCNRSEIYCTVHHTENIQNTLRNCWVKTKNLEDSDLINSSYFYEGIDAVVHLFKVVCSLDSLIIGENQILGQVKDAYEFAHQNELVGFYFNSLFQSAFRLGKRVRTETTLNEGALSISYAAVELAKKVLGKKLSTKTVGVVGSGEMGELTASHFNKSQVSNFLFFNRSKVNAEKLANAYGGVTRSLDQLSQDLQLCDIVVSATGASGIIITKEQVAKASKAREGKSQFFIDIAAPRDIDPEIQDIENTFLFTIDDLKKAVTENLAQRQEASGMAVKILEEEVENFETWYKQLSVVDTIQNLRNKFHELLNKELHSNKKIKSDSAREEFEKFGNGLINKILHTSITGIKKLSQLEEGKSVSKYANIIFNLSQETSEKPKNNTVQTKERV